MNITSINEKKIIIANMSQLLNRINQVKALTRTFTAKNTFRSVTTADPDAPAFGMNNPFEKEQPKCILCKHNITPDYKNVKLLSQFQSPYTGRIYGRHITGLCKHKQEHVEAEIVKAQSAGLMATYLKESCFLKDPKLFDPERPIRPHKY